jgi:hypothetical protein
LRNLDDVELLPIARTVVELDRLRTRVGKLRAALPAPKAGRRAPAAT